jgi:hypothetical protein
MKSDVKPFQFGIRHLLGAMFAVALVSALIAPWVRGWSAGQWLMLGTQTAVVVVSFAACLAGCAWSRLAALRRLGEQHFRVTARTWGSNAWSPASAYAMIAFATFMLFLLTVSTLSTGGKIGTPFTQGVYAGLFAAVGVTQLQYPPDQMLVGEAGVVLGGWRFIPWDQLWYSYEPGGQPVPLLLKTAGWAFALTTSAAIERSLADYVSQRARVWANPPREKMFHLPGKYLS